MKTLIVVEQHRTQLVLQYENEHDEAVLKALEKLPNTHRTEFYQCRGGYTTVSAHGKEDLIIVFDQPVPVPKTNP